MRGNHSSFAVRIHFALLSTLFHGVSAKKRIGIWQRYCSMFFPAIQSKMKSPICWASLDWWKNHRGWSSRSCSWSGGNGGDSCQACGCGGCGGCGCCGCCGGCGGCGGRCSAWACGRQAGLKENWGMKPNAKRRAVKHNSWSGNSSPLTSCRCRWERIKAIYVAQPHFLCQVLWFWYGRTEMAFP